MWVSLNANIPGAYAIAVRRMYKRPKRLPIFFRQRDLQLQSPQIMFFKSVSKVLPDDPVYAYSAFGQVIAWCWLGLANVGQDLRRHMSSVGHNKLINVLGVITVSAALIDNTTAGRILAYCVSITTQKRCCPAGYKCRQYWWSYASREWVKVKIIA